MKTRSFTNLSLKKKFYILVFLSSFSFLIVFQLYKIPSSEVVQITPLVDLVKCSRDTVTFSNLSIFKNNRISRTFDNNRKVLIFAEKFKKSITKKIVIILESLKLKYKISTSLSHLSRLHQSGHDLYSVIIFENLNTYVNFSNTQLNTLKMYCEKFDIGLIVFNLTPQDYNILQKRGLTGTRKKIKNDYHINDQSPLLRITKAGSIPPSHYIKSNLNFEWTFFESNNTNYEAVTFTTSTNLPKSTCHSSPILRDKGLIDGIEKIIFGTDLSFWLHIMIFLDALYFQAKGAIDLPLERYVLVDIDDIFVGKSSTRITKVDVQALLESQKRISSTVENFTFNLGFSSYFYLHGNDKEDDGDRALLEAKDSFWWFGHSWRHQQAHNMNLSQLKKDMLKNRKFAQAHDIPVKNNYSVAPHHAGVYPVHEELYEAWKEVWGVEVTSTEEYPSLWPARARRGFVYRNIKVLPRQVCDLYTHTIFLHEFPGGPQKFYRNILGGELFLTLLFNTMSIFMTHQSNYANDRLALFTFENVFSFVKCWTNLSLKTIPPSQMASLYFKKYPQETLPLWKNPCEKVRHREIWSKSKSCNQFPSVVVIGPQKTGTTAMHLFLNLHPSLQSSSNSNETFEEVQFFNDKYYYRGIDWYLARFPKVASVHSPNQFSSHATRLKLKKEHLGDAESNIESSGLVAKNRTEFRRLLFEKSATYFADEQVPKRIFNLLPHAKLIVIFTSPSLRAYSWYQHMRAHKDKTALEHSFYDVITHKTTPVVTAVMRLQQKCLLPGLYSQHINRWLDYYTPDQLLLVDGEKLVKDPVNELERVQDFLSLEPRIDYSSFIKYSKKKGFYCVRKQGNKMRCLGSGKGRRYPPMDARSERFLSRYYLRANQAFKSLLRKLHYHVPQWLRDDISFAQSLHEAEQPSGV